MAWPAAIRTNGRLNAGLNTFNFSSATFKETNKIAGWSTSGFAWADNQVVQLSLTMPVVDTTAPTVITNGYSPTDNAQNVAKNTNLVLTFSEAVQAGTGNIVIKNTGNAADTRTIPVGDSQVSFGSAGANLNRIVTINPTNDLTAGASYAVNIANGVITDRAATPNNYAGIGNDTTWNFRIASVELSTSNLRQTTATLSISGHTGAWWYKRTSPTAGSCVSRSAGQTASLSSLSANTRYTYKAYSATGCMDANEIASLTFTTRLPSQRPLNYSAVTNTGATLELDGYTAAWWYRQIGPTMGACTAVAAGTTSVTLTGLSPNTAYIYGAFRAAGCAWWTESDRKQFQTTGSALKELTASSVTATGATLDISDLTGHTGAWYLRGVNQEQPYDGTTCTTVTAGSTSGSVSGLRPNKLYAFHGYASSNCTINRLTTTAWFRTSAREAQQSPVLVVSVPAPASLGLAETPDGDIVLSWAAVSGATGYEYQYTVDGVTTGPTAATGTRVTISGLDLTKEHTFQVYALKDDTRSDPASITHKPAPQKLGAKSTTPEVSLSADSSVNEGNEATVTATLSAALEANVSIPLTLTDGTSESGDYGTLASITITAGQTTGTGKVAANWDGDHDADTFTVALNTGNLPSSVSAGSPSSATITINEVAVPAEVTNIDVTHNGTSLAVSWDAAARATGYDITYYNNTDLVNARGAWNHAETSLTITCDSRPDYQNQNCVESGDTYTVGVRAKNANGESHWRNSDAASYTPPATNDAPTFTSGAIKLVQENQTAVVTVVATDSDDADSITGYAIQDGADGSKFAITDAGVLTFKTAPDYENPGDVQSTTPLNDAGNNTYIVVVRATSGAGTRALTADQTLVVAVRDVNEAPRFTSGAAKSVAENQTSVMTVAAADEDATETTVTFALQGGVDQGKFAITSAGVLTFQAAPDFENPGDVLSATPANAAGNNQYVVTVRATSGTGTRLLTADQTLVISVTDVNEAPPEPVTGITVTHNGSSLYVSWNASAGATGYDVTYTNAADNSTGRGAWDHTGTTLTITCDIRAGYENQHCVNGSDPFRVGIRAKNAHGESHWRNSPNVSP